MDFWPQPWPLQRQWPHAAAGVNTAASARLHACRGGCRCGGAGDRATERDGLKKIRLFGRFVCFQTFCGDFDFSDRLVTFPNFLACVRTFVDAEKPISP